MPEKELSWIEKLPPHIHSADSLSKRWWRQSAALLPLFVTGCLAGHAEILRALLICLVSAIAFEFLTTKLFRKKENLKSGETILAAVLFSLLLPSRCPSEIVIFGVFIVIAAKELFGGTGAYPLPPLLLARAILQSAFPQAMTEPMLLAGGGSLWTLTGILLGGALSLCPRRGYWEIPVLFTTTCLILEMLCGGGEISKAFLSGILFTGIFLLADPVILPLTRRGCVYFAIGAAVLSSRLDPGGFSIGGATSAILWMSLATPWLDMGIRPAPYKTKRFLKATYFA